MVSLLMSKIEHGNVRQGTTTAMIALKSTSIVFHEFARARGNIKFSSRFLLCFLLVYDST